MVYIPPKNPIHCQKRFDDLLINNNFQTQKKLNLNWHISYKGMMSQTYKIKEIAIAHHLCRL